MAGFTQVEVEAIVAFVANIMNRHFSTAIALDDLLFVLSGLYYDFNPVLVWLMPSYLQTLIRSRKIAILAEAKVRTVCTNKAGSYNRLHIAADAFVLTMCRQSISK